MVDEDTGQSGKRDALTQRDAQSTPEIDLPETGEWLRRRERGELWLGHFQQLTTLTVTGAAGLMLLLQLGVMARGSLPFYVSLVACGIALILSLGGQSKVLDAGEPDANLWRDLREIRRAVFLALGVAAVAFLVLILS